MNQATLMSTAEPIIRRTARRLLKNLTTADRDDAMQNVRLLVWRRIGPAYRPERGGLEPFLSRAIHRALLDERRRVRAGASNSFPLGEDEAVDPVPPRDLDAERLLHSIIADPYQHLSPSLAALVDALLLSSDRGAAAKSLGVSTDSVYRMSNRVKNRLSEIFDCPGLADSTV